MSGMLCPPPPGRRSVWVVEMLTTVGESWAARSAKESGAPRANAGAGSATMAANDTPSAMAAADSMRVNGRRERETKSTNVIWVLPRNLRGADSPRMTKSFANMVQMGREFRANRRRSRSFLVEEARARPTRGLDEIARVQAVQMDGARESEHVVLTGLVAPRSIGIDD